MDLVDASKPILRPQKLVYKAFSEGAQHILNIFEKCNLKIIFWICETETQMCWFLNDLSKEYNSVSIVFPMVLYRFNSILSTF